MKLDKENLDSLLIELGKYDHGTFTLKYVYSDFHGKFDDNQWQWVAYYDDLNIPMFTEIADTPSEAVLGCLKQVKEEETTAKELFNEEV